VILQDDWNTGRERSQRQDVAGKVETVYMQDVWSQTAEQFAESSVVADCLQDFAERHKVIANALALQTLRSRACLNNRNTDPGTVDRGGNVAKSRPSIQKLHR
jgi:hypothetical protein